MVNRIKYIKGSSQENRFPEELHNDYFKIDEREFDDLVVQSAKFSKFLKYYNEENNQDKDWQAFFESVYDGKGLNTENIKEMEANGNMPPHLALLFAFLKLFKREQDYLNTLTRRHLDYNYKDILGFNRATGCAGKEPEFFELNKNAKSALVPKGTILMAGNDENGKFVRRQMVVDFVVNRPPYRVYIQSTFHMPTPEKEQQERRPLLSINDHFRKIVIVGDDIHRKEDDLGVLTVGLLDFLTDKNLLEQG